MVFGFVIGVAESVQEEEFMPVLYTGLAYGLAVLGLSFIATVGNAVSGGALAQMAGESMFFSNLFMAEIGLSMSMFIAGVALVSWGVIETIAGYAVHQLVGDLQESLEMWMPR